MVFIARRRVVVAIASGMLVAAGCTGTPEPSPTTDYTRIVPDEPSRGEVKQEWVERELAVIDALEYIPYEIAVRYYGQANEIVVTMWTYGDVLPQQLVDKWQASADVAAGDADAVMRYLDDDGNDVDW